MQDNGVNIAILGATGEVGTRILELLGQDFFAIDKLYCLASERSAGTQVTDGDKEYTVESADTFDFSQVDIVLSSAGGAVSKLLAPRILEAGATMVDNTSAFRMDERFYLCVPEVNGHVLRNIDLPTIVACPNCSTIQLVMALKPLADHYGLESCEVSTYQSVSGAGASAIDELSRSVTSSLTGADFECEVFDRDIAFDVLPRIGPIDEDGYSEEETKMLNETAKLLEQSLIMQATCARVPVFYGHSEAVTVQLHNSPDSLDEVRQLLSQAPGVTVMDGVDELAYPSARMHASGSGEVFIGRIRKHKHLENTVSMWVVSDNILKGAALNTVQIAQELVSRYYSS